MCLTLSFFLGWISAHSIPSWYEILEKPFFTPPNEWFGPVWTVLYILIGISGGLLWVNRQSMRGAFYCYLVQLILNVSWSLLFFGAHQIGWALVDILLLLFFILLTLIFSYPKNRSITWLLSPYFVWVIFASLLNFSFWYLN